MIRRSVLCAALAAAMIPLTAVSAQLGNLKDVGSHLSGMSNPLKGSTGTELLGGLGSGTFKLGSPQNIAGIMAYCQSHGYAPSATETVKDKLADKLGLRQKSEPGEDYKQGAKGMLKDAQGGTFDLSKLKSSVARQVCKMVADKAMSSLLGG